ncbi:MAG: phosphotransferase [Acidobacteriota bacterium]
MAIGRRPLPVNPGHFAAPQVFNPVLPKLQQDVVAYFNAGPLRLVPVAFQERPLSHVLRVSVRGADGNTPLAHLFVKMFKPKPIEGGLEALRLRVAREFETIRRVHAEMLVHSDLGVVPPVACYPEHLTIVTEAVEGSTLLDHLSSNAAWFPAGARLRALDATMNTVGRWLRVFQGTDHFNAFVCLDEVRRYVDQRLARLVGADRPALTEEDRERVRQHIELLGRHAEPQELSLVPVHSDMALGNVLVSGRRIIVLDFDMAKRGSRVHDLTRLFLQLELLTVKPRFQRRVVQRLQRALLDGFDPALAPDRPLFRLYLLLHRVNNLTALTVNPAPFPEALYNAVVCRQHRRWIAREIQSTSQRPEFA